MSLHQLLENEHGLKAFHDALIRAQKVDADKADLAILDMVESRVGLTSASKARLLATLWATRKRALMAEIIARDDFRDPIVISKTCVLLDGPRRIRQLEGKLEVIPENKKSKRKPIEAKLKEVKNLGIPNTFSATSSFMRLVRKWTRELPAERLEFDCVMFDKHDVWHNICDLVHPRPSDWKLGYFQNVVHGDSPPETSFVTDARNLTAETVVEMLYKHPRLALAYSIVRMRVDPHKFTDEIRSALACKLPLGDLLWHYEEIAGLNVRTTYGNHRPRSARNNVLDDIIAGRLAGGETLGASNFTTDSFGKLLERLLMLKKAGASWWTALLPEAEAVLTQLKERREAALLRHPETDRAPSPSAESEWEVIDSVSSMMSSPAPSVHVESQASRLRVAVLGDASGSMQVAINASCIIGAMMSALFDAELVFFNNQAFRSAKHASPRTAAEVLDVAEEVGAGGGTAPAAALHHFYESKEAIDLFIVVTDEQENNKHRGKFFAELFLTYRASVLPTAKVTFVSFLHPREGGIMLKRLKDRGVEANQQRFDPQRPDLSKFDALFASVLKTSVSCAAAVEHSTVQHVQDRTC
eukprot:CAMPEP_0185187106 /NCGR_PEP_ID=MMETSP1140-20130426/4509_1 /TAXON_ID=298111 /ORGANISM="Pavlova sp., Strain CCMP459" /LENGTH=584 /DNA_ID=CAMNT_0027753461 /DNA_START=212 /DNA_END=1966 /DNA_ORIENTATION=+